MENSNHEPKNIIKPVLSLSVFAVFVIIFYFLIGQDKTALPSQLIDQPVPDFSINDLMEKNTIHTQKIFLGKITLLNVWASWCPSCYTEHPFWTRYAENKEIIIAGLNYRDKRKDALKFINQQGNPYEWILFDEKGRLGIEFGVYGAPETFLIDPKGKVRYRHTGVVSPKVYQQVLLPLIEKIKKGF